MATNTDPHTSLSESEDSITHVASVSPTLTAVSSDSWTRNIDITARETLKIDNDDSAIGEIELESSTTSLNSAIYKYVEENGHTYHQYKEGKYFLPNDPTEQERLDIQHQLFLLTFQNKLYIVLLQNGIQRVLDIGTGTGIWAIDFANSHPSANVIGTDLSPIQPHYIPPNCRFIVEDAEDDWTFQYPFDFIHGRALVTCFQDPCAVIAKCHTALAPGGYLELQDVIFPTRGIDNTYAGCASERLTHAVMQAARKLGKDFTHSRNYRQYMEAAGFVDVQEKHFQWPIGPWCKSKRLKVMGMLFRENLVQGLDGLAMALLTRGLGMEPGKVKGWVQEARGNLMDPGIHAYMPGIVVYGRKATEPVSVDDSIR